MPKRYRLNLILILVLTFGALAATFVTNTFPLLGLDLKGGISVILSAQSGETVRPDILDKTVDIIRRHVGTFSSEADVARAGSSNIIVQLPGVQDEKKALELIGTTAQLTFRQVEEVFGPATPKKQLPEVTEEKDQSVNDQEVVYPASRNVQSGALYKLSPAKLTGSVVTKAEAVVDTTTGEWAVTITMNREGADKWASFTSELACLRDKGEEVKSQSAIVLDGVVESTAGMKSPGEGGGDSGVECGTGITGGDTQIDMGDEEEAKSLALVLRTGALPITLEQSQVSRVSPTLGRDSLNAGIQAGALGLALVFIYLLLYYRALGLVAWAGLVVFSAMIYTMMAVLGETSGIGLSLAGIAGIIVSIGITCDSYIVAFERLKDEIRSGKSMRAAVDRGMARAFKTILVADFVTAAAAVILFLLAVGPVKGFALTLGLATGIDVLIAYYFTRSAVGLLSKTRLFGSSSGFMGMKEALGAQQ